MKRIKITITGDRAVGKTTMGKLLGTFLTFMGCKIIYKEVNASMQERIEELNVSITELKPWEVTIETT